MIIFENLERLLYIADIYRRDGNYCKALDLILTVAHELAKPIDFSQASGIIDTEQRFNEADHPRDKKTGKFVFKGISENPHGGNYTVNGVTYDPNGRPFDYPELRLEPAEYKRVISGINTNYDTLYKGRTEGEYHTFEANYFFEIHGFDVYNIYDKEER